MERILITGGTGQLGYDVYLEVKSKYPNAKVLLPERDYMDLTNFNSIDSLITRFKPDVVFHCAAYTAVDKAEEEEELCYYTNTLGTGYIATACEKSGAKLVYISTDYAFDGTKDEPYIEEDKPNPLNVYGRSKILGEKLVLKYDKTFVVRTSWVFGLNGKNFIKTIINAAKTKKELSVIGDQIGSPTYTKDLAKFLVSLAETDKFGIYHAHNEGYTSWYELAKYVLDLCGIKTPVKEIATKDYPQKAKRPLYSVLSTDKLKENGFEPLPHWHKAVAKYVYELMYEEEKNKKVEEAYGENGEIIFPNGTKAIPTSLADCYIIEPKVFGDERGHYCPKYQEDYMRTFGFESVIQDSESLSKRGVLRGIHFQKYPFDQAKIVRVESGAVVDVVVDLRVGSPTFMEYTQVLLTPYDRDLPQSGRQLYVPRGFGHGFLSLEDETKFVYYIDNFYKPSMESGLAWNDPLIDIDWDKIFATYAISKDEITLSQKDKERPMLEKAPEYFEYKRLEMKKNNKTF